MKTKIVSIILLAILLIVSAGCTSAPAPAPTPVPPTSTPEPAKPVGPAYEDGNTIILTTGEWAPYTSETLEESGFFTEIVSAVFDEMGKTPRYEFYPWERAEKVVADGESWGAFPYSYNEERAKTYTFSDNVVYASTYFFYYKPHMEAITWETLEDLQPYTVGTVTGYYHESMFAEAKLNVDASADEASGVKKLQAGRIDLFPMTDLVGWVLIKELFPDEVKNFGVLEKPMDQTELTIMVLKSDKESLKLLEEFNTALQRIKDNGVYDQILAKYGLTPEE
jgi:polar amino acid transport system substrate-binding protein